jgi:hypothetical protein
LKATALASGSLQTNQGLISLEQMVVVFTVGEMNDMLTVVTDLAVV